MRTGVTIGFVVTAVAMGTATAFGASDPDPGSGGGNSDAPVCQAYSPDTGQTGCPGQAPPATSTPTPPPSSPPSAPPTGSAEPADTSPPASTVTISSVRLDVDRLRVHGRASAARQLVVEATVGGRRLQRTVSVAEGRWAVSFAARGRPARYRVSVISGGRRVASQAGRLCG